MRRSHYFPGFKPLAPRTHFIQTAGLTYAEPALAKAGAWVHPMLGLLTSMAVMFVAEMATVQPIIAP